MGATCALAAIIHVLVFPSWFWEADTVTQAGRLAALYALLSLLGAISFGISTAGLLTKRPNLVAWGLGLFAIGAIVQIVVIVIAGANQNSA